MLDRLTIERMAVGAGPILVALSGGGDSVALLHLLVEYFGAARLRAGIVDHALREGSADDARRALGFAEALGVGVEIFTLTWPAGPQRAQQSAREARYRALCEGAREVGAPVIAVAHTLDDQAETVLLRAARGSSWRGLAGMRGFAPAPVWPNGRDLWLARPLLGAKRNDLRALLRARGAEWIEDPANANPDFARVRARHTLAALQEHGLDTMRFAALAARVRTHTETLDRAASALICEAVQFEEESIHLECAAWRGPDSVRQRALSVLLTAAGGQGREPPLDRVAELDGQLVCAGFQGATLAGAWVSPLRGAFTIRRDPGALTGRADGALPPSPLPLSAGKIHVWDNRLALRVNEPGWALLVEDAVPVLAKGEKRAPISGADREWLLAARVLHLLAA